MKDTIKWLAVSVLVLGVVFAVWLALFLTGHNIILTPEGDVPDMILTGEIGNFVGGIIGTAFSFAATLLVVVTLMEQNRQNQRNIFVQSYYEMLHVHANHVQQMTLRKTEREVFHGREVFSQLVKNYNNIYDSINRFAKNILEGGLRGQTDEKNQVEYLKDDNRRNSLIMRLTYGYFFYGSDYYRLRNPKLHIESEIEASIMSIGKGSQFYVDGNHVILGHYYRHMFQMIQYVIDTDCLSEQEKYIYTKQLRAQLDDEEQLLLYYNALSEVGVDWLKPNRKTEKISRREQLCPMSRFLMIKNIPASSKIKGIEPETLFSQDIEWYNQQDIHFFEQR